jgi:hypothetical protein
MNLMWAVLSIRFDLFYYKYPVPEYLYLLESVLELVCYIGTFVGIFLCCAKWDSLGPKDNSWQTQQGTHPYQQQPYQQAYPPMGQYPQQYGP